MFYTITKTHIFLKIRLRPNAKQNQLFKITDDYLEIAIHAPPIDNAANKTLIRWLSKYLSVPQSKIIIKRGLKSRLKVLQLPFSTLLLLTLQNLSL